MRDERGLRRRLLVEESLKPRKTKFLLSDDRNGGIVDGTAAEENFGDEQP